MAGCLLVAGCASTGPPPVPPLGAPTIPDVTAFLAPPGRHVGDPATTRRFDQGGYQASDAFARPDGTYVTTWSYPPFGAFVAAHGDGGEVYVTDGVTVRIAATQDGGKPYVQGFYGVGCGGTGWVVFRNDAPTGSWASLVARLAGLPIPSPCAVQADAFTRYRLETVTLPFDPPVTLPTIISEHFNNASIAKATALERSFFAQGIGRVIWEAWTRRAPAGADLAARCPPTAWSVPPGPGWRLSDCRVSTSVRAGQGGAFGWPPAGLPLP